MSKKPPSRPPPPAATAASTVSPPTSTASKTSKDQTKLFSGKGRFVFFMVHFRYVNFHTLNYPGIRPALNNVTAKVGL